jgi:predicted aspartyl protease
MTAIPFDMPSPQIPFVIMRGEAGGQAVRLLFDTGDGAPFAVALRPGSAAGTTAEPTGEPDYVTHAVAGGASATIIPVRLQSFRLGPIQLDRPSAGLMPSIEALDRQLPGGLDGLVGYELIHQRIVVVDYERRTIDFAGMAGPPAAALPMEVTPKRPMTVVSARINGQGPFRLAVDTGAGATILSPQAAVRAALPTGGQTLGLAGAGGHGTSGRLERGRVEVGAARWENAALVVADLMGPVSAEAGEEIDGVLGAPLIAHGTLILDYPGRRIWIGQGAPR